MFEMGSCLEKLNETSNKFNNKSFIGRFSNLENMYVSLNNLIVNWGIEIYYFSILFIIKQKIIYLYKIFK